jgi:hypothetical protein
MSYPILSRLLHPGTQHPGVNGITPRPQSVFVLSLEGFLDGSNQVKR